MRLQKERDYHRMHHRRVVQEKERLLTDLKRLKTHYSSYEPVLQQLQHKYQVHLFHDLYLSLPVVCLLHVPSRLQEKRCWLV